MFDRHRVRMGRAAILLISIMLTLFLPVLAAGCGEEPTDGRGTGSGLTAEREITLTTLDQGVTSEYGRFDEMPLTQDAPPQGMVITDADDLEYLTSLAMLEDLTDRVDFESQIVIAAMQGPKNTGGYAISVMRATQTGDRVMLEVEVVEPEPGSITVQMLTSPYHLVTADRASFDPGGELVFVFVDQHDEQFDSETADI